MAHLSNEEILDKLNHIATPVKKDGSSDGLQDLDQRAIIESIEEQNLRRLVYQDGKEYLEARKKWRFWIGWLLVLTVSGHLGACLYLFIDKAPSNVLGWVTISLTGEVLGLSAIILRHLFPHKQ